MVGNCGSAMVLMGVLPFGRPGDPPGPRKMRGDSSTGASRARGSPGRPRPAESADLEPTEGDLEDVAIVRRVLDGQEELFEVLVRRYQARVVSHVARMVGNREDALDLSQEIFLKVFQALERF